MAWWKKAWKALTNNYNQTSDNAISDGLSEFEGIIGRSKDKYNFEDEKKKADEEAAKRTEAIKQTVSDIKQKASEIPTFTEWMNQHGNQWQDITLEKEGLQALIDRTQAGPNEADYNAAYENAARLMGLGSAQEVQDLMNGLATSVSQDVSGQQGMSDEERQLRERQNQANISAMRQASRRMVQDSLADNGSTARMLETADTATQQIANFQLQQDAQLAQDEFERQLADLQSKKDTWAKMIDANQMGTQDYMQNLQSSISIAMQGYATKVSAMMQENQGYLQEYSGDLSGLTTQIDSMYRAANLELGVNVAEIDMASQLYASEVQPYLDELNMKLMEKQLEGPSLWDRFMQLLSIGSNAASMYFLGGIS